MRQAVIQRRTCIERVKRGVVAAINCTTQYVQNLNQMFRTKTNDRRADRVRRINSEASDVQVEKSVKYRLKDRR
ncbi:hypothetical protein LI328DRAFT_45682 [Trichoderma asperelloides]|nr:hypothetical protein LI328DRAFT_45682 [Trichoderma asperelloides]